MGDMPRAALPVAYRAYLRKTLATLIGRDTDLPRFAS
jgi:hypothetical protein